MADTHEAGLPASARDEADRAGILDRHAAARRRIENAVAQISGLATQLEAGEEIVEALGEIAAIETELRATLRQMPVAQSFQSQKLEAIGQLTGGIAHDFNNLLTVITSGLQLLSRTTEDSRRQSLTRRIEEAAWRGADLTRRLLAFARRQPLNAEPLEVRQHLEGLRELLQHGLRDDISILTQIPDDIWPAEADLAALELAVLNLAVNARDAMPDGGTMVLGARNIPASTGIPEQLVLAPGDYVELSVTDTGVGMGPEVLGRVFEPFFTTKADGKGTGLGLAQVYGFAKQSGGIARVESAPGQGTTVALLLPRSLRSPGVAAARRGATSITGQRRKPAENLSILVVEDDDGVAAIVQDMVEQLGHRAVRVSSLPAAVAILSGSDCIDLIFTDVLLGSGGSGLDLARETARRNLRIPVVLTSGYGGGVSARLAAARLPFLRKPYTIESFKTTLEEAMADVEPA